MRYQVIQDDASESYKIVDTRSVIGTEDTDRGWVASAYDRNTAFHIATLLEHRPHCEGDQPEPEPSWKYRNKNHW